MFKGRNIRIEAEIVSIIGADGKTLETTNLIDFTRKNITAQYASLEDFLRRWRKDERKQIIIDELKEYDVLIDAIKEVQPSLQDSDVFDVICHVAYGKKPLTRRERANNVRKRNYFAKYEGKAREILEALLDKYAEQGVLNMESLEMLKLDPFKQLGQPTKIVRYFGGKEKYYQAIYELEQQLYLDAA